MAGCLNGGNAKSCAAKTTGGSNFLYLADRVNVASVVEDVDGKVTGITMAVGEVFYKFEFASNQSQFVEDLSNEGGTQITQTYNMVWESWNQDKRNTLLEMADCNCGMVAIHGENTGLSYIWGLLETEEVKLFTANRDSGTAKTDVNQVAPTLQAISTIFAQEFTLGQGGIPV